MSFPVGIFVKDFAPFCRILEVEGGGKIDKEILISYFKKIVDLLESIDSKLDKIKDDVSWIESHTSGIESNTSD